MTTGPRAPGRPVPLTRVSGLGELAALLPYLMGFAPAESVVLVGMSGRPPRYGRVGLTARVDLADVLRPATGGALLRSVLTTIARTGARQVLAVVVSEADTVDGLVVQGLVDAAAAVRVQLGDVGWHRGDRCFSLLCDDPRCCPPEGFRVDPACEAAVVATFAGTPVAPDRVAVEAEFAGCGLAEGLDPLVAEHEIAMLRADLDGDDGDAATVRAAEAVLDLARLHDAHREDPRGLPALSDDAAAAALAALGHVAVRDAVWLAVDAREVHGGGLWLELARRAPSPYDASPLFLLAWRCWRSGDGVRAVIAAERAEATPGGYSAARLLLDAVSAGMDPASVPRLSA